MAAMGLVVRRVDIRPAVRNMRFVDRRVAMFRREVRVTDHRLAARMPPRRAKDRDDPGDDRTEERQENDGGIHAAQPFIMLMSSTAIVPRLR
jgi:hypothetical protein